MKIRRIPAYLAVPSLCLAVALSLGSTVSADGIKSKDKSRIPMRPGLTIDRDLLRQAFVLVPAVPSKIERVSMKIRKDQRAAQRSIVTVAEIPTEVIVIPTVVVSTPGRDRLAKKGPFVPAACKTLHTHERASCISASQWKKTVRAQFVAQQ